MLMQSAYIYLENLYSLNGKEFVKETTFKFSLNKKSIPHKRRLIAILNKTKALSFSRLIPSAQTS